MASDYKRAVSALTVMQHYPGDVINCRSLNLTEELSEIFKELPNLDWSPPFYATPSLKLIFMGV